MSSIFALLANVCFILQALIFVYFILGFFPLNPAGTFAQIRGLLGRLFEPILMKLRSIIPSIGIFDMSGLVLLIALQVLQILFLNLAR